MLFIITKNIYLLIFYQQLGMKETAKRIASMIDQAKEKLNIPDEHPLDCVVSLC